MKKKENIPAKRQESKPKTKKEEIDLSSISKLIMRGDLSGLNEQEKLQYYGALCKSLGLNPYTKPFEYITFERNGKKHEMLYATKNCAEQLRKIYGISVVEEKREITEHYVIYDVKVQDKHGRTDTGTGAVSLIQYDRNGKPYRLSGTALADAIMKAQSKAKRRATLSIAGAGVLDETELDFVYSKNELPEAQPQQITNNNAIFERQALLEKFKQLPDDVRKKFAEHKVGLDKALEICKNANFDIPTILVALEVNGNVEATEDAF